MTINQLRDQIHRKAGIRDQLLIEQKALTESLSFSKGILASIDEAQAFVQAIAQETQSRLKFHIEDIAQLALDALFPGVYTFLVEFAIARGKTEVRLLLKLNGTDTCIDAQDACGGGVVDILSFALRVACHTLEQGVEPVLILDEPFKFVSADLRPQIAQVVSELSQRLGLQFIIVTHLPELIDVADSVIEIQKNAQGRSLAIVR